MPPWARRYGRSGQGAGSGISSPAPRLAPKRRGIIKRCPRSVNVTWPRQDSRLTRFLFFAATAALIPAGVLDPGSVPSSAPVRAVWLADLHPDRIQPGPERFVFVPDSRPDEADGSVVVDAAGLPGVLRTVQFARGETDEGLDVLAPIVVEASWW